MWTAEHHFQNHGFEVVPNVVLLNAVLAQRTRRIRFGSLVHVLTTWHPVRFAEDYALADVLSGGRLLCGLGRGTEPRESNPFGVNVGWNGDPDDVRNREVFEEQVAIFKAATSQRAVQLPRQALPLSAGRTGVPRRAGHQPAAGAAAAPHAGARLPGRQQRGHAAVCRARAPRGGLLAAAAGPARRQTWQRYAQLVKEYHGVELRPGEDRMLVVNMHIGDSTEAAFRAVRPGHDELRKADLAEYRQDEPGAGEPASVFARRIGGVRRVAGRAASTASATSCCDVQAELGVEYLTIFPHFPGMTQRDTLAQLETLSRGDHARADRRRARVRLDAYLKETTRVLKQLPADLKVSVHGPVPPHRFWGYYTGPEIAELARAGPERHGRAEHRRRRAARSASADDDRHAEWHGGARRRAGALAGTTWSCWRCRPPISARVRSTATFPARCPIAARPCAWCCWISAASVARSGFKKLRAVRQPRRQCGRYRRLLSRPAHRDRHARSSKSTAGSIGSVPGLISPDESAMAMHAGESETSVVRYLAPELVHMERAEGYSTTRNPNDRLLVQRPGSDRGVGHTRPGADRRHRQSAPVVGGERPAPVRGRGRAARGAARGDLPPGAACRLPRAGGRGNL